MPTEPTRKYLGIVRHYEACLARHGDCHLGVDWPVAEDAETRYQVMLEVVPPGTPGPVTLLDFGCGASHLHEHILRRGLQDTFRYSGLDLSPEFVRLSRAKFPSTAYYCVDILETPDAVPEFDYIVMNGVFTERPGLDAAEMREYFEAVVRAAFARARHGLAVNVMSSHVDWEREDLFHLPLDTLAAFLVRDVSRHFVIRNDYGLYEYTAYVYRRPRGRG